MDTVDQSTFMRWQVGEVRITRVVEVERLVFPADALFELDAETVNRHGWLQTEYADADGNVFLAIQAFVIEAGGKRVLVDPCLGNHKQRENPLWAMRDGPFLEDLCAAGFSPETIDTVLCTHLHFDHVGWNTRLVDGRWIPTFPNARYLFARTEFEHARVDTSPEAEDTFADSIKPILDAGLADFVETNHQLSKEIRLEPTPGHTPGHCSVRISSIGQEAVITGDMIHHPIQTAEPDVCTHACVDKEQAKTTRRAFLQHQSASGGIVFGSHFCGAPAVRIKAQGREWRIENA